MKKVFNILILFFLLLVLCSCNKGTKVIEANNMKLNENNVTLYLGDDGMNTYSLKAAFNPANVTDRTVKYSSSNTNIVSVGKEGLVTAIGVGEADVVVTYKDMFTETCHFSVYNVEPTNIGFSIPTVVLHIGDGTYYEDTQQYFDTFDLKAYVMPDNSIIKDIEWKSNDESIVQILDNGLLKINTTNKAHTTITFTALANNFKKDIDVFVDSYILETPEDLDHIRYCLDGRFELGSDIDMTDFSSVGNDGKGWLPIGTEEDPFTGTLIGNGYSIKNLEILYVVQSNLGLFGYTEGATIRELAIQDCYINSKYQTSKKTIYAGTFVSVSGPGTSIISCYSSGQMRIDNDESCAGGLVSENYGIISNCYSTVAISLTGDGTYAGGLAGNTIGGTIEYSYSTGGIFGVAAGSISGYSEVYVIETNGVYSTSNPKYLSCFFDSSSTGVGVPLSTQSKSASMQDISLDKISLSNNYFSNWNTDYWTFENGYYPRLKKLQKQNPVTEINVKNTEIELNNYDNKSSIFEYIDVEYKGERLSHKNIRWSISDNKIANIAADGRLYAYKNGSIEAIGTFEGNVEFKISITVKNASKFFTSGLGTISDPFEINNEDQFNEIRNYLGYNFYLSNDIDLSKYGKNYNKNRGWEPIGDATYRFLGSLDGKGHKISNLYIKHGYTTFVGLFGYAEGSRFKNIVLENIYINTTAVYVGGLVAINLNGSITECYISGEIINNEDRSLIGGFCCENYGAIMNCVSNVNITAKVDSSVAGGIVGDNFNAVTYCISLGHLSGNKNTKLGAIAGAIKGSNNPIISCYYNKDESGTSYGLGRVDNYIGIVGLSKDELKEGKTYEEGSKYFQNYSNEIWKFENGKYPTLKNNQPY